MGQEYGRGCSDLGCLVSHSEDTGQCYNHLNKCLVGLQNILPSSKGTWLANYASCQETLVYCHMVFSVQLIVFIKWKLASHRANNIRGYGRSYNIFYDLISKSHSVISSVSDCHTGQLSWVWERTAQTPDTGGEGPWGPPWRMATREVINKIIGNDNVTYKCYRRGAPKDV